MISNLLIKQYHNNEHFLQLALYHGGKAAGTVKERQNYIIVTTHIWCT